MILLLAALLAAGQPSPPAAAMSNEQIRELLRQVSAKDLENNKKQRDYTYTERAVERQLDSHGNVKSTESKTYEVMELYGEQVRRLVDKNGHPLSGPDARKEEDKIRKLVEKRKNESESDRQKRQAKEEERREHDRQFVREVADAYNFHWRVWSRPAGARPT